MKIVLISGASGTGKTAICQNLCERYDKFHFVDSYTDRDMREPNEWGHQFVDTKMMDLLLESQDIVAKTEIDEKRYCTLRKQFDKDKINLYTVDVNGINDTIKAFPRADVMTILIRRRDINLDGIRSGRDVIVPLREDVDFLIDNNGKIESAANLLNVLVSFDFFRKPSHVTQSLHDRIEQVHTQCRFLKDIRNSLYEQLWYENESLYRQLCKYVEQKVNEEFDFDIKVAPDSSPEISDGYLNFNIQGEYPEDVELYWADTDSLIRQLSYHARTFCQDNNCNDIAYRLTISEKWAGEDRYV